MQGWEASNEPGASAFRLAMPGPQSNEQGPA
jgi:hypothetical protein